MLEKQEVTPDELDVAKDTFREELLTDRRNRFFSAYMVKAKQKMKIEVNREALQRVVELERPRSTKARRDTKTSMALRELREPASAASSA